MLREVRRCSNRQGKESEEGLSAGRGPPTAVAITTPAFVFDEARCRLETQTQQLPLRPAIILSRFIFIQYITSKAL